MAESEAAKRLAKHRMPYLQERERLGRLTAAERGELERLRESEARDVAIERERTATLRERAENERASDRGRRRTEKARARVLATTDAIARDFERTLIENYERVSGRVLTPGRRALLLDQIETAAAKLPSERSRMENALLRYSGYSEEGQKILKNMTEDSKNQFLRNLTERRAREPIERLRESGMFPTNLRVAMGDIPMDERLELTDASRRRAARTGAPDAVSTSYVPQVSQYSINQLFDDLLYGGSDRERLDPGDLPNYKGPTARQLSTRAADDTLREVTNLPLDARAPGDLGDRFNEERMLDPESPYLRQLALDRMLEEEGPAQAVREVTGGRPARQSDLLRDPAIRRALQAERQRGDALARERAAPYMSDPSVEINRRSEIPGRGEFEGVEMSPGTPASRGLLNRSVGMWEGRGLQEIGRAIVRAGQAGDDEAFGILVRRYNELVTQMMDVNDDGDFIGTVTNQDRFRGAGASGTASPTASGRDPLTGPGARAQGLPLSPGVGEFADLTSRISSESGVRTPFIDRAITGSGGPGEVRPSFVRGTDPRITNVIPDTEPFDPATIGWGRFEDLTNDAARWDFDIHEGAPDPSYAARQQQRPEPEYTATARSTSQGVTTTRDITPVMASPAEQWDITDAASRPAVNADTAPTTEKQLIRGLPPDFRNPYTPAETVAGHSPLGPQRSPIEQITEAFNGLSRFTGNIMPTVGKGLSAFGLVGDILDAREAGEFNRYLQSQGRGSDPTGLTLNALGSVPLLGPLIFNRQRFMQDPGYRQQFEEPLAIT